MSLALLIDKHVLEHPKRAIRLSFFLCIAIIAAYFANAIFGFTYIYENKRLEAIERITDILSDSSISPQIRLALEQDLNRVVEDGSYLNRSLAQFSNSSINPFASRMITESPNENRATAPKNIISEIIGSIFYILCCSGLYFWVFISCQRELVPGNSYLINAGLWVVSIWSFLLIVILPFYVIHKSYDYTFDSVWSFYGLAFLYQIGALLTIIVIIPLSIVYDWIAPPGKRIND